MAQRLIHYLFGKLLSDRCEIRNENRFLFGSLLPDAYRLGNQRIDTHFISRNGEERYFGFERFRKEYPEMHEDDLYLGYYMHLVEDSFYRINFDDILHRYTTLCDVDILHNDYHILNSHIVEHYDLSFALSMPCEFANERINEISDFLAEKMIDDLHEDFIEHRSGSITYIDSGMLDDFIERYIDLAAKEIEAIRNGRKFLANEDYIYRRSRIELS